MGLTFGNPAGLWALAAIPVILLIHFLQRETRREVVSTLFLIERLQRESQKGRHFERLRNSASLWLQILAALLLTWLLVEPRWMRSDSVQRVAVVLDDSVSMQAFLTSDRQYLADLGQTLRRTERTAAETEWMLLESSGRRGTLYSGSDRRELLERSTTWRPRSGTHNAAPAIRQAIASTQPGGSVLFITDRRRNEIPEGVEILGIGEPIGNVGFTGLRMEEREGQLIWRALVRNYGDDPIIRYWWAEYNGQPTEPREIRIGPRGTLSLSGVLPGGVDRGALILEGDRFETDDRIPFVRPLPKTLFLALDPGAPLQEYWTDFLHSMDNWRLADTGEDPDFKFSTYSQAVPPSGSGVFFWSGDSGSLDRTGAPVVAERHRLTDNLSWMELVATELPEIALAPEDSPLVWKGDRPLLVLRETQGHKQLLVCFDIRDSNASRLPAFVILLHRFMEELRGSKIAYSRANVQTDQRLNLAVEPFGHAVTIQTEAGAEETLSAARAGLLRSPNEPGFFTVYQGETLLLDGAAHFADAREADFRNAESFHVPVNPDRIRQNVERNSRRDFLAPLWMLLLGGAFLMSWKLSDRDT